MNEEETRVVINLREFIRFKGLDKEYAKWLESIDTIRKSEG